jgi:hypothetical protein
VMTPQTIRRYRMGPVSVASIVTSVEPCRGACPEDRGGGQARGKPVFTRSIALWI